MCDLETSRIGSPYIYICVCVCVCVCDISSLRVKGKCEKKRNIIRVTESRNMRVTENVACVGIWEIHRDLW